MFPKAVTVLIYIGLHILIKLEELRAGNATACKFSQVQQNDRAHLIKGVYVVLLGICRLSSPAPDEALVHGLSARLILCI